MTCSHAAPVLEWSAHTTTMHQRSALREVITYRRFFFGCVSFLPRADQRPVSDLRVWGNPFTSRWLMRDKSVVSRWIMYSRRAARWLRGSVATHSVHAGDSGVAAAAAADVTMTFTHCTLLRTLCCTAGCLRSQRRRSRLSVFRRVGAKILPSVHTNYRSCLVPCLIRPIVETCRQLVLYGKKEKVED